MREDTDMKAIEAACRALSKKVDLHVSNYGHDIESRLTGAHETAPYNKFSWGVSNRGASVRLPWQVSRTGRGYACLLYTSDAADERSSVDLGGRRIIKKHTNDKYSGH